MDGRIMSQGPNDLIRRGTLPRGSSRTKSLCFATKSSAAWAGLSRVQVGLPRGASVRWCIRPSECSDCAWCQGRPPIANRVPGRQRRTCGCAVKWIARLHGICYRKIPPTGETDQA
jgi:hypothetical protein